MIAVCCFQQLVLRNDAQLTPQNPEVTCAPGTTPQEREHCLGTVSVLIHPLGKAIGHSFHIDLPVLPPESLIIICTTRAGAGGPGSEQERNAELPRPISCVDCSGIITSAALHAHQALITTEAICEPKLRLLQGR